MKKTSTRLATIGGTILLGACAIALAQHDSRKKDRELDLTQSSQRTQAEPIGLPSTSAVPQPLVRANNELVGDTSPSYDAGYADFSDTSESSGNPLRGSQVVLASADEAVGGGYSTGSGLPPALPVAPTQGASSGVSSGMPAIPAQSLPHSMPAQAPPPIGSGLPTMPTSAPENALPSAPPPQFPASGSLNDSTPATLPAYQGAVGALSDSTPASPVAFNQEATPGAPADDGYSNAPSTPGGAYPTASIPAQTNNESALPSIPTGTRPPTSSLSDTQRPAVPMTDLSAQQPSGAPNPSSRFSGATSPAPDRFGATGTSPARSLSGANPSNGGPGGYSQQSLPTGMGRSQSGSTQDSFTSASPAQRGSTMRTASGASNAASMVGLASLVSDQPGNRYLDGQQRPDVSIEIRPPAEEIQVGKKATFMMMVTNHGGADALNVRVVDKIPQGTRFSGSEPEVNPNADGLLVWDLGTVPAGEERLIRINLIPEVEGEIGSMASVMFAAQASVRTLATKPKLEIEIDASPSVMIGSDFQPRMTIRNAGTGVARNVTLEVDVPSNLSHPGGSTIGADLNNLYPSESRPIDGLVFAAAAAGQGQCVVRALTEDGVQFEKIINVEVKAPKLVARIQGPRERYLQREAAYTLAVMNNGTAPATNLDFAVHLPAGLKYVGCSLAQAEYDRAQHILHVGLTELPAGTPAEFQVRLLPVELGPQSFTLKANGDLGATAEAITQVDVNGRAELEFLVRQDDGVIEVGATKTYEVRVLNKGDKPDRNVRLQITLPEGARLVNVNPQVKYRQQGNTIDFEPIAEMPIRDTRMYSFEIEHNRKGTQLVKTRIISENLNVGVLKEIPTFVYDDNE